MIVITRGRSSISEGETSQRGNQVVSVCCVNLVGLISSANIIKSPLLFCRQCGFRNAALIHLFFSFLFF